MADAAHLPWPDARFDQIGAASLLNVVPDPGVVLRECHRVSMAAGILHLPLPAAGFGTVQARQWVAARGLQGVSAAAYLNWHRMAKKLEVTDVLAGLDRCGWPVESSGPSLGGLVQWVVARARSDGR